MVSFWPVFMMSILSVLIMIVVPMMEIGIAADRRAGDFVAYEEQEGFQKVCKFTFGGLSVGDGSAVTV
jgi:hypothetical protein